MKEEEEAAEAETRNGERMGGEGKRGRWMV